jgi:RNA polymerase sigma-70 factor (ECF subfamily)
VRRAISQPFRQRPALVYESLSDAVLVARARDADERALEVLLARHQEKVERLTRRMLRDPEDARDASQEALAKVCVRLAQFRGGAQFSTWLHRLVVNTCLDAVERRKARTHEPLGDELESDADPSRDVRIAELRRELCDALAEVSPQQAQVVLLKDALGYSFEEIAEAAGMPVGTAKCHAHRGRARLSERLSDVA